MALGAVPLALWVAANPVAGAVVLGGVGCAVVAAVRVVGRHASDPEDRDGSFVADQLAPSAVDGRHGTPPANARR